MSVDLEPQRRIGSGLASCLLAGFTVIFQFWCGAATGVFGLAAAVVTSELLAGSVPTFGDLKELILGRMFLGPFAIFASYWSYLTVPLLVIAEHAVFRVRWQEVSSGLFASGVGLVILIAHLDHVDAIKDLGAIAIAVGFVTWLFFAASLMMLSIALAARYRRVVGDHWRGVTIENEQRRDDLRKAAQFLKDARRSGRETGEE